MERSSSQLGADVDEAADQHDTEDNSADLSGGRLFSFSSSSEGGGVTTGVAMVSPEKSR